MKYTWGRVIHKFDFEIDGHELEIIKYHPLLFKGSISTKEIDLSTVMYGCDEISQSADSMMQILVAWMVYKQLGMNQGALVQGISRMLKLGDCDGY